MDASSAIRHILLQILMHVYQSQGDKLASFVLVYLSVVLLVYEKAKTQFASSPYMFYFLVTLLGKVNFYTFLGVTFESILQPVASKTMTPTTLSLVQNVCFLQKNGTLR